MPKIVDKEEVRGRILDATMQVYSEVGFHAATISGIAKASGMGKGTLYLYFDSKEALTVALADRIFGGMGGMFMGRSGFKSIEAFKTHLKQTMTATEERAKFVRVFFEVFGPSFASPDFVKSVASFFDEIGDYYSNELESLKAIGEVRSDLESKIAGRTLAAMIDGVILHRGLFAIPKNRHAKMINAALDLLIEGMKSR